MPSLLPTPDIDTNVDAARLEARATSTAATTQVLDLGRMRYADALERQIELVELRKKGGSDRFLIVEHPHVVTMGRNGHLENLLAQPELLARSGIEFYETDRGGDVTYHGPGQVVGYPILDLREWKRDVHLYVRAIEQVIIDALAGAKGKSRRLACISAAG
jgi:lipoyl(octanoyl) transferase